MAARPSDSEGDEKPRARAKKAKPEPAKGNMMLFVLLGGGAVVVLLFGCVLVGVLGYVFWPKSGAGANKGPAVTKENWDKIKPAWTRQEVEDLLGPGEKSDMQATQELLKRTKATKDDRGVPPDLGGRPDVSFYLWRTDRSHLVVGFVSNQTYGDLAVFSNLYLTRDREVLEAITMETDLATIESKRKTLELKRKRS